MTNENATKGYMVWLWLIRFSGGERFRKAKDEEKRLGASLFALLPFCFIAWQIKPACVHAFLANARGVSLWLLVVVVASFVDLSAMLWARFIPVRISYMIAAIFLPIAFWVAWHSATRNWNVR